MQFNIKTCALVSSSFLAPLAYMALEKTFRRTELLQSEFYSKPQVRLLPDQRNGGCAGHSSASLLQLNFHENSIGEGLGNKIHLQMCVGGPLAITDGFPTPEELQSVDIDALMLHWDSMSVGEGGEMGNVQDSDEEDLPITDEVTSYSELDFALKVDPIKFAQLQATYQEHIGGYWLQVFNVSDRRAWKPNYFGLLRFALLRA